MHLKIYTDEYGSKKPPFVQLCHNITTIHLSSDNVEHKIEKYNRQKTKIDELMSKVCSIGVEGRVLNQKCKTYSEILGALENR